MGGAPVVPRLRGAGADPALVGAKGAALDRLVAAGFPVPPTAVVTTDAYRAAVATHPLADTLAALRRGRSVPDEELDAAFLAAPPPPEVAAAIAAAARVVAGGGRVAVRSSATVEDLEGSSFAGQYRSLLDVDPADPSATLRAVALVWASLWHAAPRAYRRALGVGDDAAAMAVVVMAMVPARQAGVAFTVDPGGAPGAARVEAVAGLGEGLVSGRETPSAWVLPRHRRDAWDCPQPVAEALALALEVEARSELPQDVEWAWDGRRTWLVQARPITVSAADRDDGFDSPPTDDELTTAGIEEVLPGVLPPLLWELDGQLVEHAFRRVLDDLGVPDTGRGPLLRRVHGRAALDFSVLRAMAEALPGGDPGELEAQYFGVPAAPGRAAGPGRRRPLAPLVHDVRVVAARRRSVLDAEVVCRATEQVLDQRPDLTGLPPRQLLAYRLRLLDLAQRGTSAELAVAAAAAASYRRLELLLSRHLGQHEASHQAQLVTAGGAVTTPRADASAGYFAGPTWQELGQRPPTVERRDEGGRRAPAQELLRRLAALPAWRRHRLLTGQVVDVRRHVVHRTIADTVAQLSRRERTKAAILALGGEVRRVHLVLGHRLVALGALERAGDVELLTTAEVLQALEGRAPAGAVLARRRRALARWEREGPLPVRFTGLPQRAAPPVVDGGRLVGWAASPGRHTGRATVVRSPDQDLPAGDVLVAAATDASWSPLFLRAGAVVSERGGPLSHAAILARELGLPAVLNVPGATAALAGRLVTVDGDDGVVLVHGPAAADPLATAPPGEAASPAATAIPGEPAGTSTIDAAGPIAPASGSGRGGRRWRDQLLDDVDPDRLCVFVPAIMSVGLLFSLASLAKDALRWSSGRALQHRSEVLGARVAALVAGTPPPHRPPARVRRWYLAWAVVGVGGGAYAAGAATLGYATLGGQLSQRASLLALGLVAAVLLTLVGLAAAAALAPGGRPPVWAVDLLHRLRLVPHLRPHHTPASSRPELLWLALVAAGVAALQLAVVARAWEPGLRLDRALAAQASRVGWYLRADVLDPLGQTEVAVALAGFTGLAAFRCRVLALTYPAAVATSVACAALLKGRIPYARPDPGPFAGLTESFPSGHLVQATLVAGLFPLALGVLLGRRGVVLPARVVLALAVAATALARVRDRLHWPSDVLEGVLVGLVIVLLAQWLLEHRAWHRHCPGCLWHPASARPRRRGALPLARSGADAARLVARAWSAAAVLLLVALTVRVGIPRNEDGQGFAVELQVPVQLGLATLVALAIAVAWRWEAVGAVLLAVAATGLAVFSAVEYPPVTAVWLAALFAVPAVLFWVSWQHRRRWGEIVLLALGTAGLLGAGWAGASQIYDSYFGPAHPESSTVAFAPDVVEWVWSGALEPRAATVVARVPEGSRSVVVRAAPSGGGPVASSPAVAPDDDGIARLQLRDLRPGTRYAYEVVVDGHADRSRGTGQLTTPADGPQSFRVALGACARTGSNGAVFDRIRAEEPLFLLHLGDLHYRNIATDSPSAFRAAYQQVLTAPAPAALWRSTPVVYTWDDHDYGPNDADASSPSRPAARATYRQVVPHHPLAVDGPDAPIHQAFTVGRVRFVVTDGRSERTDASLLGADQLAWLLDELASASRDHALVVWANTIPWIEEPGPGAQSWGAYPDERRRIADALVAHGVENLVMVSGDAHMVAIDDGTNSGYAAGGGGGFPVLHAAALDRPGNHKGGPYSEGAFPGAGQYGLLEVVDDGGDRISVHLAGKDWTGRTLVSWRGELPVR